MFIPFNNNMGNMSNKSAVAMLVTFNLLLVISFTVLYYLFTKDIYKGSFWKWCWDDPDRSTNQGLGAIFLWIPMFLINGIALCVTIQMGVEKLLFKGKVD